MIILSGVLLFNYIFYKNINENNSNKIILLFLFISSIVFFKSGLMRSDTPHIKYTSGLYTLILYYFIIYFVYRKIKNNQIFKNLEIFFLKKTNMYIFVFFIIIVLGLKENIKNLNNIADFNKNFTRSQKFLTKNS